jgi:hypothetical protein
MASPPATFKSTITKETPPSRKRPAKACAVETKATSQPADRAVVRIFVSKIRSVT